MGETPGSPSRRPGGVALGAPLLVLAGTGLGAVVTVLSLLPGAVGLTAAVAVLCAGAFLLWPLGRASGRHHRRRPAQRR
ncbi:hypothetical protein KBX71_17890 [Micromonospora sp. D93]|uniref:hypothetical protein n=1 Tax=Micromonospora sp. D93 TaxID=2824886 RepID=UPI001B378B2B|nr:hypothetical protein [Micromonospora sp. D93]MBQ1019723.1 hypothetical protein [Micromonospora sp. D93]